jgi:hypothetical protein
VSAKRLKNLSLILARQNCWWKTMQKSTKVENLEIWPNSTKPDCNTHPDTNHKIILQNERIELLKRFFALKTIRATGTRIFNKLHLQSIVVFVKLLDSLLHLIFFSRLPSLFVYDKPQNDSDQPLDPVTAHTRRFPKIKKIHDLVKEHITESIRRNEHHYNLRHRPSDFSVGDKVMTRNFVLSKKVLVSLPNWRPNLMVLSFSKIKVLQTCLL